MFYVFNFFPSETGILSSTHDAVITRITLRLDNTRLFVITYQLAYNSITQQRRQSKSRRLVCRTANNCPSFFVHEQSRAHYIVIDDPGVTTTVHMYVDHVDTLDAMRPSLWYSVLGVVLLQLVSVHWDGPHIHCHHSGCVYYWPTDLFRCNENDIYGTKTKKKYDNKNIKPLSLGNETGQNNQISHFTWKCEEYRSAYNATCVAVINKQCSSYGFNTKFD